MNTGARSRRKGYMRKVLLAGMLGVGIANSAHALEFDLVNQQKNIQPGSISVTTSGVTATATAYHVEFTENYGEVFGPFKTGSISGKQVFGTNTSGNSNPGLGLTALEDWGQEEDDLPFNGRQPGFDNAASRPIRFNLPPSIQFALFTFSRPVTVTKVVVDDTSNFGRKIWAAGGNEELDFTKGLVEAFRNFAVVNRSDDASDGPFAHNVRFRNIKYLAVGTALPRTMQKVGRFRPSTTSYVQFYINSITFRK